MKGRVVTLPDPAALAHHVAEWMTTLALAASGDFRVSLSGGPERLTLPAKSLSTGCSAPSGRSTILPLM